MRSAQKAPIYQKDLACGEILIGAERSDWEPRIVGMVFGLTDGLWREARDRS